MLNSCSNFCTSSLYGQPEKNDDGLIVSLLKYIYAYIAIYVSFGKHW